MHNDPLANGPAFDVPDSLDGDGTFVRTVHSTQRTHISVSESRQAPSTANTIVIQYDQEADVQLFHSAFSSDIFAEEPLSTLNVDVVKRFWMPLPLWHSAVVNEDTVRSYFIDHFAPQAALEHFGTLLILKQGGQY